MLAPMSRHQRGSPTVSAVTLLLAAAVLAGCKSPQPFGDRHSMIVHADSSLWLQVDSAFRAVMERPIFTTVPEPTFKVTFVATTDTLWSDLRKWRQVAVLGTRDHPVVDRLAGGADLEGGPPTLFQVEDRWARNQTITVMLLPGQEPAAAVEALLPEMFATLWEQYRDWMLNRMYASGVNDSLADALSALGFRLRLPNVYTHFRVDSAHRFRNMNPDPGTRIRSVLVAWRDGTAPLPRDSLRAWRERAGREYYDPSQELLPENLRFDSAQVAGRTATELRGVWQDLGDYPAAGPFIARSVACADQGRTYLLDAWLYAPGDDKHPYLLQLEYILDSFRCSEEDPVEIAGARSDGASGGEP